MQIYRAVRRRMELYEGFGEGIRLLNGRHIAVEYGEECGTGGGLPAVRVFRGLPGDLAIREVGIEIVADRAELAYSLAEEVHDFLAGNRAFRRIHLSDRMHPDSFRIRMRYVPTLCSDPALCRDECPLPGNLK